MAEEVAEEEVNRFCRMRTATQRRCLVRCVCELQPQSIKKVDFKSNKKVEKCTEFHGS